MKKPDLLILIAIWEFVTAFLATIGIAVLAAFAFPPTMHMWNISRAGAIFGMSLGALALVLFVALAIAAGIGLLLGKAWGRTMTIVHSALSLLNIPIGTIIGALALAYLFSANVKAYFEAPRKTG
jgi:hypothetical protein